MAKEAVDKWIGCSASGVGSRLARRQRKDRRHPRDPFARRDGETSFAQYELYKRLATSLNIRE